MDPARAIRATRGALRDLASVRAWMAAAPEASAVLRGRRLLYFNGAFSPPTTAHAHIVKAAALATGADAVWLDPEPARPGKERWQGETLEARLEMCELMLADLGLDECSGVGTLRHDLGPERGSSVELFNVLRALIGADQGGGRLTWALGADVFESMHRWSRKAQMCLQPGKTCDELVLFIRGGWTAERVCAAAENLGGVPCDVQMLPMPAELASLSSHFARLALAASLSRPTEEVQQEALRVMLPRVVRFCLSRPDVCRIYQEQVANTQPLEKVPVLAVQRGKRRAWPVACNLWVSSEQPESAL